MLDGRLLIDVHQHPARRTSVKPPWDVWTSGFGSAALFDRLYRADGTVDPAAYAAFLREEGVDVAFAFAEYSPKATGVQAIEDAVPLAAHSPGLVRLVANVNPHLHHPIEDEAARQLDLGAVALKVHPVHGGFAPDDRALYPAYALCQERGVPVVVHCGTSTFAGSTNSLGDPTYVDAVLRDFPRLQVVLAHGGRGWWYDAAASLALMSPRVWIELSGLPPSRLTTYYARHDWRRLTRRMIFGTDWPGVPGIARNARAVAALMPDEATAEAVLSGNARQVYRLEGLPLGSTGG